MRILCISAQKPDSTGSGVYLAETVRSMIASGHEVAVIAGIDRDDQPILPDGCRFFPVRYRTNELPFSVCGMSDVMPYDATRYRDMKPDMVTAFRQAFGSRIKEVVRTFKPEAILCHHLYLVCSVMVETIDAIAHDAGEKRSPVTAGDTQHATEQPKCTLWALSHSTDLRQLRSHDLERERIIAAVNRLDGIMSLHHEQAAEIVDLFGVAPHKVHVVGTGYNSREFNASRSLRSATPLRILYVGKICKAKGVESLVRCLSNLPKSLGSVELTLVGGHSDQTQYDRITQLAEQSPVAVRFAGRVSQDDLVKAYRSSHVFVLPSFYEGLPLVTIEAMACGCRAVVTDLPGVRPWLDAALPDAPVHYVETPTIIGTDTPVENELPAFEARLAEALTSALVESAANPTAPTGFDTTAVSWDSLAGRIVSLLASSTAK
jgi:glycosyltransferase involved in cell wall biosynthesis